jgi:hypothetical protein
VPGRTIRFDVRIRGVFERTGHERAGLPYALAN